MRLVPNKQSQQSEDIGIILELSNIHEVKAGTLKPSGLLGTYLESYLGHEVFNTDISTFIIRLRLSIELTRARH